MQFRRGGASTGSETAEEVLCDVLVCLEQSLLLDGSHGWSGGKIRGLMERDDALTAQVKDGRCQDKIYLNGMIPDVAALSVSVVLFILFFQQCDQTTFNTSRALTALYREQPPPVSPLLLDRPISLSPSPGTRHRTSRTHRPHSALTPSSSPPDQTRRQMCAELPMIPCFPPVDVFLSDIHDMHKRSAARQGELMETAVEI
eukprot:763885-Hanusia_phi.AAC.1